MCVSVSGLVPATFISPIRTCHFFFYGEKSPASMVKVPAAILNPGDVDTKTNKSVLIDESIPK